jgi:DNA modification methylase
MSESFLNNRVHLHCGDCRDVLARLEENSIDACVTDPPYHLTNIVKRFGSPTAKPVRVGDINATNDLKAAHARAAAGFMGKIWDGGDIAFDPETWRAVYRVLKPGAHLLAMGGTRTYHRMACAIEDAGFEIRDTIMWLYGSGFPKSHDVSKGIDRLDATPVRQARRFRFTEWLRGTGLTAARIDALTNTNMGNHYTTHPTQPAIATREHFELLRPHIGCEVPAWIEELIDERTVESENFKRREVVAYSENGIAGGSGEFVAGNECSAGFKAEFDITAPATDAARQWAGFGTALKPACEMIVLARKPLSESTVAANVLKWGTGAINVDGCRVPCQKGDKGDWPITDRRHADIVYENILPPTPTQNDVGRWPANIIHDGSEEVTAAFPEEAGSNSATPGNANGEIFGQWGNTARLGPGDKRSSAARFFYTAKADSDDRLGSKHPTVKPLDLMQYLVRLITPPKGTVLDLFAGTGTLGEAAWREGMSAVLIEREAEYCADIRRRMALALAGPDERVRESIKAKNLPIDHGPLFSGISEAEAL